MLVGYKDTLWVHTVFSVPKFQTLPTVSTTTDRQKQTDSQTPTPNTNDPPEAQKVPRNSKQDQQQTDSPVISSYCFRYPEQFRQYQTNSKQTGQTVPRRQQATASQKDTPSKLKEAYIIWLKVLCLAK